MKKEPLLHLRPGAFPEGKCAAGFSGGADSTALMVLLAAEKEAGRTEILAVHVNHGLRGRESDEDEEFCRDFCRKMGIPLRTARADLGGRTDENACREARFRCFREIMEETGIRNLVLAHNRDDVAETFLMRLMRGAGTEGLGCMGERDSREGFTIWRPLTGTGREEIRAALREAGIPWREDSSNESGAYLRNRIRKELLPLMEKMAGGVTERIARTAAVIAGDNRALQGEAESFLREHSRDGWLDTEALAALPETLGDRILRTWWKRYAPERKEHALDARQTEELSRLAKAGRGKISLPGDLTAEKGRNGIYLTGIRKKNMEEIPYTAPETRFGEITLRTLPPAGNPGNGTTAQEVPAGFAEGCTVRTRRPGDRIRPFGMEGSRKLQDYFTDRGVDAPWRDEIPLLCRGNEVLLAAGIGAGAVPPWREDAGNIRLEWQGELPWKNSNGKEKD